MPNALIVDDEDDIRLLLRLAIDGANHGLRVAAHAAAGEEALEIHADADADADADVDVVVLDSRMPGLSGIETAKALLEADPDLPIVLYSATWTRPHARRHARLVFACASPRAM